MVTFSQLGKFGRLGNQLFQVASTIGIAKKNGMQFGFPEWFYQNYFLKKLPAIPILRNINNVNEFHFHYEQNRYRFNYDGRTNDLRGYFQSEKYWNNCKEEVLSYLQFTEELIRSRVLKLITVDVVAIHVRRGDYVNLQDYHPLLPLEYYKKAMQHFGADQRFIVFSDDIEWCKKHFLTDRFSFANGTEIEDLCLMSMCSGHIIANSSFSWWGAYLANSKKVIAPKRWFGAKANHDTKDLFLNNWILI